MNAPTVYIITMTPAKADYEAFSRYIRDSVHIMKYWNYIPGVFCIQTMRTAPELTDILKPFLKEGFFIVEINKGNMSGYLPAVAWTWFDDNWAANELSRRLPPPGSPL